LEPSTGNADLHQHAEGASGEVFGYWAAWDFEVATNRGSAFQLLGAGKGSEVNVVMEG